ncbi:Heme-binding protein A [Planctomycetaceae bacterium]|nr:Heme-binding protein A [Planctomycetaceae bacterium]
MTRSLTLAFFVLAAVLVLQHAPVAQDAKPRALALIESQDPRTLDPQLAGDVTSARHCMLVYETLLEFDPFEHTRLQPCLASAMPVYDAEKLTYTFKLRDDVYFADDACFPGGKGRKLVAADFVYSFKRLAALPQLSNFWIVQGSIEGLDAFSAQGMKLSGEDWRKHLATPVSGLSAPDERTFVVKLTQPFPQFLYVATMSYIAALAHEACEKYGEALGKHPVGTGPYTLKEWKAGAHLEYVRNPSYRDVRLSNVPQGSPLKPHEGKRLPLSDSIRFEIIDDDKQSFARCMAGEFARTGLSREQRAAVLSPEAINKGLTGDDLLKPEYREKGLHLSIMDEPVIDYIAFNMKDEVLGAKAGKKGKAVRKALALCIDRKRLVREHQGGVGTPADRLIPPGIFGHGGEPMPGQRFDAEAAREGLRQAGFRVEKRLTKWRAVNDDGQQVTVNLLLRSGNEDAQAYAKFISECGEQAGLKVVCEMLSFAEFLKREQEGTGQAYDAGWVMDYPDAQNVLQLLYGPNKPPGMNVASFENAEFDKCYEELARLSDQDEAQAKRKVELIKRMTEIVDDETPWVPLNWRQTLHLYREGLRMPPACSFSYTQLKYTLFEPLS